VHVRSCLDLGKIQYESQYGPCRSNITQTGYISIVIKLVFLLRVTITIKGETQMGSVSNKDSMGY
jgi:hypothetical protein